MADNPESRRSEAARPVRSAEPDTVSPVVAPEAPPEGALALAPAQPDETGPAIDYDPADYRWVPVRRRPRYDGWTEEKQRRFIETLADTGLVTVAAKAVGMSKETAYRLRRAPHGAAFARAWDAARHHAGGLIEDIAFERAIEGVEQDVYNGCGEVVAARLVYDNRLLRYLLSHLKPERYGARAATPMPAEPALVESLRAMEPVLPAPPEQLLEPDDLAHELLLAQAADGVLPHFLNEQHPPKSDARIAAEEAAARMKRGEAALAKREAGGTLTDDEFADECYYIDPVSNSARRRRSR